MKKTRMLAEFLRGSRLTYAGALLAVAGYVAVNAAVPLIIRQTLDSVIGKEPLSLPAWLSAMIERQGGVAAIRSHLWIIPLILLACAVLQGTFQFLRGKMAALTGENTAKRLRDRLFNHVLRQPFGQHVQIQTGDVIQRCTSDIETVQNFIANQSVESGAILLQVLVVLSIMISLQPLYTLVSVALIPPITWLTIRFFKSMMKVYLEADEAEGVLSSTLQENLAGVRVVKAFAAQPFEIGKYDESNRSFRDSIMKIVNLIASFWATSDFLCMLQFATVIVAGAWWVASRTISLGTLVAFITYSAMLIWPIRSLGQMMGFMGQAFVSAGRVQEILDAPAEAYEEGRSDHAVRGHIVLDHVHFGYSADQPLLSDISLEIQPGSTVAFLGSTGSGKSSLAHLLLRLYDYQAGSIKIDGVELAEISRSSIRRQIGIVLQEPFLFSRTIAENIRIGQPGSDDGAVREAAAMACVDEAIREFPDGYDTMVGERGVTLSGGQRQRVAIARTVLREVPILIFDDSLSAVDTETDAAIRMALRERRRQATTLIISHRITTLAEADCIYVLDQGRIAQKGTHTALIQEDGPYRRIWQIQADSAAESPACGQPA